MTAQKEVNPPLLARAQAGLLAIAFGVLLFARPGAGALAVVCMIG